jgi:hypothetical protein
MVRSFARVFAGIVVLVGTANADRSDRTYVVIPVEELAAPHAASQVLYLERCTGGCVIKKGSNDARSNTSTIPQQGPSCQDPTGAGCRISEYVNADGVSGSAADEEWDAVVQCVREVYSPYQIAVTDQRPVGDTSYHLAIVAGTPPEVGLGNDILGIAPLAGDCSAIDNVISFSFANAHSRVDEQRVFNLCWTAAQESAHAFGLDHQYSFQDGRSACNDPMTYRTDCGGQRFFRNAKANCGENQVRACRCGATQNSHLTLQNVFGAATSIIPAPTVVTTTPQNGGQLGAVVIASAGSKRGIAKVEMRLNGFAWGTSAVGAPFGRDGQPTPAPYSVQVPSDVPSSVIDVVMRAYDDLGNYTDSVPIRVTKGAPCTNSDACATDQTCDAEGRCVWPPATGEVGDACAYSQVCISGLCTGTADTQICTQTCDPTDTNSCPLGLSCVEGGPGEGVCFPLDDGGCCSVGSGRTVPWLQIGLGLGLFGIVGRRRRHTPASGYHRASRR